MKTAFVLIAMTAIVFQVSAQKFYTRDGRIFFSSNAPLEKIEAVNNKVSSVLIPNTGELEFAVLIKSFHFEKALMEEHFNENYLESSKYPKATFKGKISNISDINLSLNGTYRAAVTGDLTIHGVTKSIQADAMLTVSNGTIRATSKFELLVADYQIEIPKVMRENIAKVVQVDVEMNYKPLAE